MKRSSNKYRHRWMDEGVAEGKGENHIYTCVNCGRQRIKSDFLSYVYSNGEGKMNNREYRQYETTEAANQAANDLKDNGEKKVVVCGDDWTQVRYIKTTE